MNNITTEKLGQTMIKRSLSNGLCVCFFPKRGFQKKYAMYSVNFGSVDSVFSIDGKVYNTPAGVAHFLEHKVFEQEDTNALQKFAEFGASPNAFTSETMTAYHFECVDNFYESLKYLLHFVNHPYFTPENVEKEQGIIGQEIGMVNDNPSWRAYNSMLEALYPDHTIRQTVIGTVESISKITDELLYKCHSTFYRPENMVLTVAGDLDFEKVCAIAEKAVAAMPEINPERLYSTGDTRTGIKHPVLNMEIFKPLFMIGFRNNPLRDSAQKRRRNIIADLSAQYLLGSLSPLFQELYAKNILERDFEAEYDDFPEGGVLIAGGESTDPDLVCREILSSADNVRKGIFDNDLFEKVKKASYGLLARTIDSPEALCTEQARAFFGGTDFLDFAEIYETISRADVENYISNTITNENYDISIINPLK